MSAPKSASEPRPNDDPFYIPKTCEKCGSKLVYHDSLIGTAREDYWFDEFECPKCRNGLYMDWPKTETEKLLKASI